MNNTYAQNANGLESIDRLISLKRDEVLKMELELREYRGRLLALENAADVIRKRTKILSGQPVP